MDPSSLAAQVYVEAALHAGNTVVRRQNSKHFTRQHDPKIALFGGEPVVL
jgi:hypothetical protein